MVRRISVRKVKKFNKKSTTGAFLDSIEKDSIRDII